jgi:hypothetical protein
MLQMLSEMILGLVQGGQAQVALGLLDLAFAMMDDLPYKDEIVARIRKMNGQRSPDDEITAEEKKQQDEQDAASAQESQMLKALQTALLQAEVATKNADATNKQAQALKNTVEAQMKKLEGFLKAMEAAGAVATAPQIVAAADALIAESQDIGGNNGSGSTRQLSETPEG